MNKTQIAMERLAKTFGKLSAARPAQKRKGVAKKRRK